MTIKYITNVRLPTPRAQGYAIMKMCEEFGRAGKEVELIIPDRKGEDKNSDPFSFYNVEKKFKIIRLPCTDFLARSYRFGRLFYWIDILSFLVFARLFAGVGKNDILYTRDFLVILFFPKKRKICLELHDMPTSKFLLKLAVRKPKLFFVLNQNMKDDLINIGVEASKIHIFPSGVDVEKFDIKISQKEAREKVDLPHNKKIILYSGQLYSWKGAETLADAAHFVPEAAFIFVGGIEPELSKFKEKYKKTNNVTVLPFQERDIIPVYLKAADVLVLPNSSNERVSVRYTSPLKLFEYMASKKPIVASDLNSIRGAINGGECVFAEPDSPKSFADAIKKILNNDNLAKDIAESAFRAVTKCSWQKRAENILSIIENK